MIRILLGRGGSGKSRSVLRSLAVHQRAGRRALLLVPEQYTLQAERDLIAEAGMGGLLSVEVMSPTRLARDVLHRAGRDGRACIDALGRAMALRRVAGLCRDELQLYGNAVRRPRFCGEMAALFGDMKRFDVGAAVLRRASEDMGDSLLARKLHDVTLLMDRFDAMMEGRSFWDPEDRMNAFVEALERDGALRGVPVYLDGFDYLPPQSVRMVCALAAVSGEVTVTLAAAEEKDGDREIFAAGETSAARIRSMAEERGIPVETVYCHYEHPDKPAELRHLERELFCFPAQRFAGSCKAVRITEMLTMQEEIDVCAGRILALVQAGKARYRDIAVLCADLAGYAPEVERTFRQWGIPVFLDAKRSVLSHPLSEVVLSALQVLAWGWQGSDMLRLAKSGLLPLTREEVEAAHIYLEATRRRGRSRIAAPWGEKLPMLEGTDMESVRSRLVDPLLEMADRVQEDGTAAGWARAITGLLRRWEVDRALETAAREAADAGRADRARESEQLWDLVQDLLEQMASLIGEEPLDAREVMGMLETGLAEAQVGVLPELTDGILVGDVGRTKLSKVEYLFVLGAREGAFPTRYAEGIILSDRDMAVLSDRQLEVGRDAGIRGSQSRYGAYAAVTKPQRALILSYALSDLEGETATPSRLLGRIGEMFDIPRERASQWDLPAPELHMSLAAEAIRTLRREEAPKGPWKQAVAALYADPIYRSRVENLLSTLSIPAESLPSGIAGARYSSVSRLEQYARCPFAWFMEYVIKPREWDSLLPDPAGEGSYIHEVLYIFSQCLQETEGEPDDAWIDRTVEDITSRLAEEAFGGTLHDTAATGYLADRMREICTRTARGIARQCRRGEFRPVMLEESFGPGSELDSIRVTLPDGTRAQLSGKVDRVDVFSMGDVDYLRIIDYKSGQKGVELEGVKDGYQLQLWIYLDALCRGWKERTGREGRPAGVFYCPARDAYETADAIPADETAEPQPLSGLMLDDPDLIRATERDWQPGSRGSVTGILQKKDGTLGTGGGCSARMLQAIRRGAGETVAGILQRSADGVIAPSPLKTGQDAQCAYCPYRAGCQNGLTRTYYPRSKSKAVKAWLENLMEEVEEDAPLD